MDINVRDFNSALLAEGDSVTLIKDLKLRGSSTVLKRGTMLWQQIISALRLREPCEARVREGC